MADSDEDGLMLNLQQDFSTSGTGLYGKKKTHNKAKERRKDNKRGTTREGFESKGNKREKSAGKANDESSNNKRVRTPKRDRTKEQETDQQKPQFHEGPSEFFSSLFTKNPEIPEVPKGNVTKAEIPELFSQVSIDEPQLSDRLMKALKDRLGFEKFTEVQKQAIPAMMAQKDVLIKSPTGSGKTLAYALPLIQRLQAVVPKINRTDGPYAVVLLPTRELAIQSYEVFESMCRTFVWIVPGLIVGGENRKAEKSRIRKGINIIVATPGRLLDHLKATKSLSLKNLLFMIYDEADRLLDMGFQQTITSILEFVDDQCDRNIQTALLSATLNPKVENLVSIALKDPKFIDMTKKEKQQVDDKSTAEEREETNAKDIPSDEQHTFVIPGTLKQYFVIAPAKLRLVTLIAFLLKYGFRSDSGKIIVFFSSKSSTELHNTLLSNEIVEEEMASAKPDVYKLHGDMKQSERNDVFRKFKKCKKGILLCTDVAARGLDLPHVNWIIQYSCPTQIHDYIHRVGRTARIGAQGESLLFLLPSEVKYIAKLEDKDIEMQKLELFGLLRNLVPKGGKKAHQSLIQDAATELQNKLEGMVSESNDLKTLAEKAFRSFIQSYATYPASLKEIFHVKKLHLGHIAKSFALRTAPQQMTQSFEQNFGSKKKDEGKFEKKKKRKAVDMSESGGGVVINGPMPGGRKLKRKRK